MSEIPWDGGQDLGPALQLEGNELAAFALTDQPSAYAFVRRTLVRFEYHGLLKPDKGPAGDPHVNQPSAECS